ncbi:hypothetical protein KUF71_001699 [Frankliniella fusca]|uniref:Uncharacterized protein n=1 Tax=Frankliniella fusca TaxID=407009 RepID=A0AAE1HM12_9NEOP|nr:hypothetical protein KUF71_001699 [Frankliniella fusca]
MVRLWAPGLLWCLAVAVLVGAMTPLPAHEDEGGALPDAKDDDVEDAPPQPPPTAEGADADAVDQDEDDPQVDADADATITFKFTEDITVRCGAHAVEQRQRRSTRGAARGVPRGDDTGRGHLLIEDERVEGKAEEPLGHSPLCRHHLRGTHRQWAIPVDGKEVKKRKSGSGKG